MSSVDIEELRLKTDLEIKKLMQETGWLYILKFYMAMLATILATVAITATITKHLVG